MERKQAMYRRISTVYTFYNDKIIVKRYNRNSKKYEKIKSYDYSIPKFENTKTDIVDVIENNMKLKVISGGYI